MNYLQLWDLAGQALSAPLDDAHRPLRLTLQKTASHHLLADADARWLVAARSRSKADLRDARAEYRVWRSPLDAAPILRAAPQGGGDLAKVQLMGSLDLAPAPRIETRRREGLPEPVADALEQLLAQDIPPRGRENFVLDGHAWGWTVVDGARHLRLEWREDGPSGWAALAALHRKAWDLLCHPD